MENRQLKIALVDNMNNNFFSIVRYFRDLGVDAHLFTIPSSNSKHFRPENDTYADISDATWIKEFPCNYRPGWIFHLKKIRNIFVDYDFIISCGQATGILHCAGVKVDMFIPFGSDLINQPFSKPIFTSNPQIFFKALFWNFNAVFQRKGIKAAKIILSNKNWKVAELAADKLNVHTLNYPRLMVYNKEKYHSTYWSFLDKHDFVCYSPTRHLWKTNAEPMDDFKLNGGAKRNDKLIKAFGVLVKENLFDNPLLVLSDYGKDVPFSRALIQKLGIEKYVVWTPILPRKVVMEGMAKANVVADQFRELMSGTSAGTTNEAMAVGTPVLTYTCGATTDVHDPYYNAPILDVLKQDEIQRIFLDFYWNPEKYQKIGTEAKEWFNQNVGVSLAVKYLNLLKQLKTSQSNY